MTEEAKALQEIAKTTGQAITTVERLGSFLARAMGEPIDATCGMIADTLKFRRWKRQLDLLDKAERIMAEWPTGNKHRIVPPKLVLPLFTQASVEDDEKIHTLYARLLAAAMDSMACNIRSAYLGILQQVEPIDIQILDSMHRQYSAKAGEYIQRYKDEPWFNANRPSNYTSLSGRDILKDLDMSPEAFWVPFDNLCRLGLADSYFDEGQLEIEDDDAGPFGGASKTLYSSDEVVLRHGGYDDICITALGCAFVEACKYGGGKIFERTATRAAAQD
jgi:hypothetical protein